MQRLKEVYSGYADRVAFLAVDVDPGESAQHIRSYKMSEGFTWPMAPADVNMLKSYNITRQASKVSLDSNGIIQTRTISGGDSEKGWRELLDSLQGS